MLFYQFSMLKTFIFHKLSVAENVKNIIKTTFFNSIMIKMVVGALKIIFFEIKIVF